VDGRDEILWGRPRGLLSLRLQKSSWKGATR
jgi:hypothetical protein